jgi:hypothetical protein
LRGSLLATVCAALLACTSPEPARHPAAEESRPRAAASAAPGSAAGTSEKEGGAVALDAGATGTSGSDAESRVRTFTESYPDERRVAPDEWAKAHGARGAPSEKDCWDLGPAVGVPPAPGLLCVFTQGPPLEKLGRIYRLQGTKLERVWQATLGTEANWLELIPRLASDGSSLELQERSAGDCERALCQYAEKAAYGIAMNFGAVLKRGCNERGVYAYRDGNFVHTQEPEPGPTRLPAVLGGSSGCE